MRKVTICFLVAVMGVIFLCFPAFSQTPGSATVIQGITLVSIPGGTFIMGKTGVKGAEPVHQVTVSAFQMGRYEITNAQWRALMRIDASKFSGDNLPVENVAWNQAMEFCRMLSEMTGQLFDLPTEAEWEYACRAGTTTNYYTGDSESDLAKAGWYFGNSLRTTHAVGQKEPNAFGLYDMHGNVSEWCKDFYGSYSGSIQFDPVGPSSGKGRVIRGGSWSPIDSNCRSADRGAKLENSAINSVGFRVVRR